MDASAKAQANDRPVPDTTHVEDGRLRSSTWTLLGALLRDPPGDDLLALLVRVEEEDAAESSELAAAWHALSAAARMARPAPLDDEFHDLFIGIGRGELVPYGSWYRTGYLMDRPLVALRRDLALLGLERDPGVREPEDHAAALAETMALLTDPCEGQDESTQRLFFAEHVDSWMPTLFADMQAAQSADFYRAVGRVGEAFMALERAWLHADDPRPGPQTGPGGPGEEPQ